MLSMVSLAYVVSYLPTCYMIVRGVNLYDRHIDVSKDVLNYLLFPLKEMYFLSCTANPVIYTFVNPSFRSRI